jgi:hypothetical protein
MGVGVLFTVDLDLEIRAKSGWVKHFSPLLHFPVMSLLFSRLFAARHGTAVRVGDMRRAAYQKVDPVLHPNLSPLCFLTM